MGRRVISRRARCGTKDASISIVPLRVRMIPDIDKTILVVEDQEDARAALSGFLEAKGYIVACAENGLAALDEIKTRKPRLILLDLAMPVMDGYTFMNQARQRH